MHGEYGHKKRSFTLRMDDELRKALESKVEEGSDLTKEINARLRASLREEEQSDKENASLKSEIKLMREQLDYIMLKLDQMA